MTSVKENLAYKNIGPSIIMRFSLAPETGSIILRFPQKCKRPQSGKIREVSGKTNGKEKQPRNNFFPKLRNPGRSGKFPGRETGREKPTFTKTRSPGRSRKIPGMFPGRDASTVSPVLIAFPPVSPKPYSPKPVHVFMRS